MSMIRIFAQRKLRLSGVLNSVPMAGLQHLDKGLFPMAREAKITIASRPLPQKK